MFQARGNIGGKGRQVDVPVNGHAAGAMSSGESALEAQDELLGGRLLSGRVVSDTPGRLRIRVCPEHRNRCLMQRVQVFLQVQRGIGPVEVNALTGSLLVWYAPGERSADQVLAACRRGGLLPHPGEPAAVAPAEMRPHYRPAPTRVRRRLARPAGHGREAKRLFDVIVGGARLAGSIHLGIQVAQAPGPGLLWHALDVLF